MPNFGQYQALNCFRFEFRQLGGERNAGLIDARNIWTALESKNHYTDWLKPRIAKMNLKEGVDFLTEVMRKEVAHQGGIRRMPLVRHLMSVEAASDLICTTASPHRMLLFNALLAIVRTTSQVVSAAKAGGCGVCGERHYAKGLCVRHYKREQARNRRRLDERMAMELVALTGREKT